MKTTSKKVSKRKTAKEPTTADDLLRCYCRDIDEWPKSWAGSKLDIALGKDLVKLFVPFLLDRIEQGRAPGTIKIYARFLWALGGELISQVNYDEDLRKLSAKNLLLKNIDDSGGPLWRHAYDELEHNRYDSVCRCLWKFMTKPST